MRGRDLVKKYLGGAVEVEIGDDVFKISPLPAGYFGEFWDILNKFSDVIKSYGTLSELEMSSKVLSKMDKETVDSIIKLVWVSLQEEYSDLEEEETQKLIGIYLPHFYRGLMKANIPDNKNVPGDTRIKGIVQRGMNDKTKVARKVKEKGEDDA